MNLTSRRPFWHSIRKLGQVSFFAIFGIFLLPLPTFAQLKNQSNFKMKLPDEWKFAIEGARNTLKDVQFLDDQHGWAVGDSSTILRTTNGGENWETIHSSEKENFTAVYFIDNDTGWIGGRNNLLLKTSDHGSNWKKINSPIYNDVRKIQFIDELIGLIFGDGALFSTVDGGKSWAKVILPDSNYLIDFVSINETFWWIATERAIYVTEDAGKTWAFKHYAQVVYPGQYRHLKAINQKECWAFYTDVQQNKSNVSITTDGGKSWIENSISVPTYRYNLFDYTISSIDYRDVALIDTTTAYIVGIGYKNRSVYPYDGHYATLILKTNDSGKSWLPIYDERYGFVSNAVLQSISFKPDGTGFAVGSLGLMVRVNQDSTKDLYPERVYHNLLTVGGTDSLVLVSGGTAFETYTQSSVALSSTSKGRNWSINGPVLAPPKTQIRFKNNELGWKVGFKTLSRTNDGGKTWKNFYDSTSYYIGRENILKATFQGDSTGWFLSGGFTQLYSFSGSKTTRVDIDKFEKNKKDTILTLFPYPTDFSAPDDSTLFVTTAVAYVLRIEKRNSQITGKVLPILPSPQFGLFVKPVRCFFVTSQIGWVVCSNGEIFKTVDGGESWSNQTPSVKVYCRGTHFISEQIGYLVGEAGILLKTTNGGTTWIKVETHTYNNLNDINFIDGVGYIVGDYGTILRLDPNADVECQSVAPASVPFRITKF